MKKRLLVFLLCLLTSLFLFEAEEKREKEKFNYDFAVGLATIGENNKASLRIISWVFNEGFFPQPSFGVDSYRKLQNDFLTDMKKRNKRVEFFYRNNKIGTATIKNVDDSGCGDVWADLEVKGKSIEQLQCTGIIPLDKRFKVKETYKEITPSEDQLSDLKNWAQDYCIKEAIKFLKQKKDSSYVQKKTQGEIENSDFSIDKDKINIKAFYLNKTKTDLYIISTPYFKCSKKVVNLLLPNFHLEAFPIGWFLVVEIKDGQKKILHSEEQEGQYNEIGFIDLCDFDGDEMPELVFEIGEQDGTSRELYKILEKELKLVAQYRWGC